jgi:hypothetical protein
MKLIELKAILDMYASDPRVCMNDIVVLIQSPNSIGARPTVKVKYANLGFDWDDGKFILICEQDLMVADNDLINRVRKAEEKYGWADYEMRGLEAQVKRLTKRIKELEDERE